MTMNLKVKEIAVIYKIELAMNIWMRNFLTETLAKSSVNPHVAAAIITYSTILKKQQTDLPTLT